MEVGSVYYFALEKKCVRLGPLGHIFSPRGYIDSMNSFSSLNLGIKYTDVEFASVGFVYGDSCSGQEAMSGTN